MAARTRAFASDVSDRTASDLRPPGAGSQAPRRADKGAGISGPAAGGAPAAAMPVFPRSTRAAPSLGPLPSLDRPFAASRRLPTRSNEPPGTNAAGLPVASSRKSGRLLPGGARGPGR